MREDREDCMFDRLFKRSRGDHTPDSAELLRQNQEKIGTFIAQIMKKYPGTYVFSERGRAEISSYLPLLRETYTKLAKQPTNPQFLPMAFLYATALRKTGAFEEAAQITRSLPLTSYETLIAFALAEEALGNSEACIAAYREAITLKPLNVAARNDLGKRLLMQGKLAEALVLYEESMQLAPDDPYQDAEANIAYLKYLLEPSPKVWLEKLKTLAHYQEEAHKLLSFIQAPYIGELPNAGEAMINVMRKMIQDRKAKSPTGEVTFKKGSISLGTSSLEAPSAGLAIKLLLEPKEVSFTLQAAGTLSPDPRQPLRPVEYLLWRYEDMTPIPAVPPPDPAIAEHIAVLAQTPYALDRWHWPARELGESLGPSALISLLGVMVHPPTPPEGWETWDWLYAVQIASALTIAFIDKGWVGSRRKAALTSLIYGPMDWSGAAALIAMAVLARQDMRIHIEFDTICCDLWNFGRGSAEWPHEYAMVFGLHFVGGYSDEAKMHIKDFFDGMKKA